MSSHLREVAAIHNIEAGALRIAYQEWGPADGPPVILLHGFPYDIYAYAVVSARLARAGCRVIVPFLRGFGETRFLRADTPRNGQQSALAHDLLHLMDAMHLPQAILAGYDWGGRAACILAALFPQRVRGLLSGLGYAIQNIATAGQAAKPLKFNTSGTQVVDFIGNGCPIADYKTGLERFSGVGRANSKAANNDF